MAVDGLDFVLFGPSDFSVSIGHRPRASVLLLCWGFSPFRFLLSSSCS
jgi:hypothetical protein